MPEEIKKSFREEIIEQLNNDLLNITIDNGYGITVKEVREEWIGIDKAETLPMMFFELRNETFTNKFSDKKTETTTLELILGAIIDAEKITDLELTIKNVKKFFRTGCNFRKIKTDEEMYLGHQITEIMPYYIKEYSKGIVLFLIKIYLKELTIWK